jgi:hypothetical protein
MLRFILIVTVVLLAPLATTSALAQIGVEVHRLEIRDGSVFHDGEELPESALPEGFDASGVSFTFEYSGSVMPAITLNGHVYALQGERLVALDSADDESPRAIALMAGETAPAERRRQAEQAYLQTLSERDRALYERLIRERDMEEEALRLAYLIRRSEETGERNRLTDRLREQLGSLFEIKQQNRQEEIVQVEVLLDNLREQMRERQRLRSELIEQRLLELTGQE